MSSMGLKTHTGIDPITRIEMAAHEFNKAHGKNDPTIIGYTDDPSLSQMRYFLKIGDVAGAKKVIGQLAKNGDYGPLIKSMREWSQRPFTSRHSEGLFLAGMDDAGRQQYQDAVNEKYKIMNQFRDALNQ